MDPCGLLAPAEATEALTAVNPELPDIRLTGHSLEHRDNKGASSSEFSYWDMCTYGSAFGSGLLYVMIHTEVTRDYFDIYFADSIGRGSVPVSGIGEVAYEWPDQVFALVAGSTVLQVAVGQRPDPDTDYTAAVEQVGRLIAARIPVNAAIRDRSATGPCARLDDETLAAAFGDPPTLSRSLTVDGDVECYIGAEWDNVDILFYRGQAARFDEMVGQGITFDGVGDRGAYSLETYCLVVAAGDDLVTLAFGNLSGLVAEEKLAVAANVLAEFQS